MIEVQLPDGTVVEFPDGTSDEVMRGALQNVPPPPPRETTMGEFAGGLGLSLAKGTMRATKAIPDLASFVLPDAVTDPWSEFFERGIDSAEALKPEAFKQEARQGIIKRDANGGFAGFQLPSAEAVLGVGVESLPQVPFFLAGGAGTANALRAIPALANAGKGAEVFGYGLTNAAMVAPDQWRQTYQQARAGDPMRGIKPASEEEARARADWAASWTAALTQMTGSAGGAVAQKLGAESSSLVGAVLKGFAGEAPFEGVEESGQNVISDIALSRPIDWLAAADVGGLAALAGGAPGAGVGALEYMTGPREQDLGALAQQIIEAESRQPLDLREELHERIDAGRAANEPIQPEVAPALVDPIVEAVNRAAASEPPVQPQEPAPAPTAPEAPADPIEAARARIRERLTMAQQAPAVQAAQEAVPAPEPAPIVPEPAPVAESQPVQPAPAPVQEPTAAPEPDWQALEAQVEKELAGVKKPPTLLDALAGQRVRLDRNSFRGDLVQESNVQAGTKWLFEGKDSGVKGMNPDQLLEYMQQNGWLPENPPNAPPVVGVNDAVELLNRALQGERIVHDDNIDAELNYQRARQYEIDKAAGGGFGVTDEADLDVFARTVETAERQIDETLSDDEIDRKIEELWNSKGSEDFPADWLEDENVDEGTVQGSSVAGGETQAGLLPEATPQERVRAAEEAKTAERNRLGQDEIPVEQGEGELFAGNEAGVRPTQNTLLAGEAGFDTETVWYHGRGNEESDLYATPNDETGISGVSLTNDPSVASRYASPETREYRGENPENVRSNVVPVHIRGRIVEYSDFVHEMKMDTGIDIWDASDADILEYANKNGIGALDYSRTLGDGEISVLDPKNIRSIFDSGANEVEAVSKPQNTIFTEEDVEAARERLKSKLGTARSGVDPEMLKDMAIVAGYHIEKGARTFAQFTKAMVEDFGEAIRPYLEKLWEENKPPAAAAEPKPRPRPAPASGEQTSTKNAVADAERAARDLDPVMREARQSNPDIIAKAEAAMRENPDLAEETIQRLMNDPDPTISVQDEAVLFIAKVDLRREMRRIAEKAGNEKLSDEQRQSASQKYNELLSRQNEVDHATHASGSVWGRLGQLRSRMMNDDYSFEAQVRDFAVRTGKAPSADQIAIIKKQADEITRLTAKLEEANRKAQEALDKFLTTDTYEQLVKQADKGKKRPTTKQKLRQIRNQEVAWIKQNQGRLNALPVDMVYHLAKLGSVIIAEGAVNFATWAKRMKKALGEKIYGKIEGDLEAIYTASQDQYQQDKVELAERSIADLKIEAEALAETGEELTHRLVYQLARSHILAGVRGEDAVMQAVHEDLAPYFEGLTERDVRRLFSEYGKAVFPSQDEDRKALRELRRLVQIQESIDRLKEGLDPLRSGPQRDKATQEIREKQKLLNDLMRRRDRARPVPSREKLASINEQRIRRLENQIADLEKQIATGQKPVRGAPLEDSPEVAKLKAKRDALKRHIQEIEEAKKPKLTAEEKYNELRGKQLRRELAEVARRLRENDYAPRKRKEPPSLNQANKDLRAAVVKAKMDLHEQQMDWMRENWPLHKKVGDWITQGISLSRAVMTSLDLSAVLRQGGFMLLSNPRTAIKSFVPMIQALKNDANAAAVNDEILSRPNADLYQKAKLYLAEQDSAHPTKMEEVYMGRWQKKVPGVAASGRAYVTFLNKLRADTFDSALAYFSRKGEVLSIEELRSLAAYINNATGRFDLTKAGAAAGQGLSNVFFAPRWMLSRFAMILGVPMWRVSGRMRKYVAWQYAKYMMGMMTLYGLAALTFGGDDEDDQPFEFDPRSTDFGKMKVGNTRLDMMSGLSQPLVFLSRILSGGKVNTKGDVIPLRDSWRFGVPEGAEVGFGQDTGWTVAERFMRTKFAPPLTAMANMIDGQNVIGEDYADRGKFAREVLGLPAGIAENPALIEATGMFTPLAMRDFYDAMVEHGLPAAAALQVLAVLGVAMNTYSVEDRQKNQGPKPPKPPQPPKPPEPP